MRAIIGNSIRSMRPRKLQPSQIVQPFRKISFDTNIMEPIQNSILSLHNMSGSPWWLTIVSSTLVVRTALFPLVRYQILASRKLGKAIPEVNFLFQLFANRMAAIPSSQIQEKISVLSVFLNGVRACFVVHQVNTFELIFYPIVNFAIFASFVFSIRDLVINGDESLNLTDGGIAWFYDLSEKDKTFILPMVALCSSYMAVEIAVSNSKGKLILLFKDVLQSLLLLSAPFVHNLPAGVFCYWIPNSLFGIAQSLALRNPRFMKVFRIPPLPTKPPTKP